MNKLFKIKLSFFFFSLVLFAPIRAFTDDLYVTVDGVGVNTSTPSRTLHIADDNPKLRLSDNAVSGDYGQGVIEFFNEESDAVQATLGFSQSVVSKDPDVLPDFEITSDLGGDIVLSGGNVGVGTDKPSSELEVNGVITVDDGNGDRSTLSSDRLFIDQGIQSASLDGNSLTFQRSSAYVRNEVPAGYMRLQIGDPLVNLMTLYYNTDIQHVVVHGELRVDQWRSGSLGIDVCRIGNYLAECSSSRRYKKNIDDYTLGLEAVLNLRPVEFNWKEGGERDLGFIAEDIAQVEPQLATYSKEGEVEGVKYRQMTALLVNAIQEQQKQIEALRAEVQALKQR